MPDRRIPLADPKVQDRRIALCRERLDLAGDGEADGRRRVAASCRPRPDRAGGRAIWDAARKQRFPHEITQVLARDLGLHATRLPAPP